MRAAISSTTGGPWAGTRILGVHGARPKPERSGGRGGGNRNPFLGWLRQARRRDVEGLLEKRTVQAIGLVKESQRAKHAVSEQSLERHLGAGHERLAEHLSRGDDVRLLELGRPQQAAQPGEGDEKTFRVVGS